MLLADNLENTGQIKQAIVSYQHALDMIPCRFEPLESMMTLSLNNRDTLSAMRLAQTIISKPIKVNSIRVQEIIKAARIVIDTAMSYQTNDKTEKEYEI